MNLAVKLCKDASDKPAGIPDLWPAEVRELGESSVLPEGAWALMTYEEYTDYVRYYKPSYDTWYNAQVHDSRTYADP